MSTASTRDLATFRFCKSQSSATCCRRCSCRASPIAQPSPEQFRLWSGGWVYEQEIRQPLVLVPALLPSVIARRGTRKDAEKLSCRGVLPRMGNVKQSGQQQVSKAASRVKPGQQQQQPGRQGGGGQQGGQNR